MKKLTRYRKEKLKEQEKRKQLWLSAYDLGQRHAMDICAKFLMNGAAEAFKNGIDDLAYHYREAALAIEKAEIELKLHESINAVDITRAGLKNIREKKEK